jgi:hypothetical protein
MLRYANRPDETKDDRLNAAFTSISGSSGSGSGHHIHGGIGAREREDARRALVDAQLRFYFNLIDIDHDGWLSTRDLLAADSCSSRCIRYDLRLLLTLFSSKIEQMNSGRWLVIIPLYLYPTYSSCCR